MKKKVPDAVKELRERIEDMVRLFGLCETEKFLHITIFGFRSRVFDKNTVIEIGEDKEREK